ncbi:MAG: hypothetical protein ACI9HA_001594, partial [Dinoroseobacter sp.]
SFLISLLSRSPRVPLVKLHNYRKIAGLLKVYGGDLDSTPVTNPKVHVERVVTLVNQLL